MPLAGFDEGTLPEDDSSNGFLDGFQTVLDIAGLVPGFGEIADGINAAIYVARGDYANAALSAAAMLPIGGQAATAAKLGMKVTDAAKTVIKNADEAADATKAAVKKSSKDVDKTFDASKATNKQKGNFGEIKATDNLLNNPTLKQKGYDLKRIGDDAPTGLDDKIKKGVDGIYENATPLPKYVIDEAKYGKSRLGKTKDGKQMHDDWVKGSDRLADQVGKKKALEIERAIKNGEVEKVLSKIDKNGNVVTKKLDSNGKVIGDWP